MINNTTLRLLPFIILVAILFVCSSCGNNISDGSSSKNNSRDNLILTAANEKNSSAPAINFSALDNTCIGWGPGKIKEHQRPSDAQSCNLKFKEYNAVFVGENTNKVYLTFDEGYENGYTAPILDTLKEKKVKAVFFVTYDYVKRNPELVKRMIDEGHTVGNHSYSHPSIPSKTTEEMKSEVMRLHYYVKNEFNYDMTLFRFPMGEYSTRSLAVVKNCGYKSVFWSFAYVDWKTDAQPDAKESIEKVVNGAHNGAIYLLHAVSSTNNAILGSVIDDVRKLGYEWSTL